jgi:hypothetical protein
VISRQVVSQGILKFFQNYLEKEVLNVFNSLRAAGIKGGLLISFESACD